MKKIYTLAVLFLLALCGTGQGQDVKAKKVDQDIARSEKRPAQVRMVITPTARFTTHWTFLVDTSHSTHKIFNKVKAGFFEAVNQKIDELFFGVITFNNGGNEAFWPPQNEALEKPFTPENLEIADHWINDHCGILSYGCRALELTLKRPIDNLTVILISDGGFTEATGGKHSFAAIYQTIEECQQWRVNRGLSQAIICSIGVENRDYGWPKPPDVLCQEIMRNIGVRWGGGYFLATDALDDPK